MTAAHEALEQVREAIRFQRDDHHRDCNWRKGQECDCYNRFIAPYHEALDFLAAELARMETERGEMREALRDIATREWRDEGGRIASAVARDALSSVPAAEETDE